jgi:hypothetical protein
VALELLARAEAHVLGCHDCVEVMGILNGNLDRYAAVRSGGESLIGCL